MKAQTQNFTIQKKNSSSNFFPSATESTSASFAVGQYCPVSMELMVLRETPTKAASSPCDKCFSARASLRRFFKMSFPSIQMLTPHSTRIQSTQ